MKFKAKYQPELCVSQDETRPHLTSVHLDKAKSVMVATNGHMLVRVPCEPEATDTDGAITPAALREARRVAKSDLPRVRAGRKLLDAGDAIFRRPAGDRFVPWETVLPSFKRGDKGTVTFGVNPHYLVAVLKAMGSDQWARLVKITLKITPDMLDGILVEADGETDGAIAVVMPGMV